MSTAAFTGISVCVLPAPRKSWKEKWSLGDKLICFSGLSLKAKNEYVIQFSTNGLTLEYAVSVVEGSRSDCRGLHPVIRMILFTHMLLIDHTAGINNKGTAQQEVITVSMHCKLKCWLCITTLVTLIQPHYTGHCRKKFWSKDAIQQLINWQLIKLIACQIMAKFIVNWIRFVCSLSATAGDSVKCCHQHVINSVGSV